LVDSVDSDFTLGVRYPLVCAKVVSVSTGEVPVCVSSELFMPTQR
jgi:hypothetical protein